LGDRGHRCGSGGGRGAAGVPKEEVGGASVAGSSARDPAKAQ
jgi:hypothetical protein